MSGWDRQVNAKGDSLADATAAAFSESTDAVLAYLDLITECLVRLAWQTEPDGGIRQSRLDALRSEWPP